MNGEYYCSPSESKQSGGLSTTVSASAAHKSKHPSAYQPTNVNLQERSGSLRPANHNQSRSRSRSRSTSCSRSSGSCHSRHHHRPHPYHYHRRRSPSSRTPSPIFDRRRITAQIAMGGSGGSGAGIPPRNNRPNSFGGPIRELNAKESTCLGVFGMALRTQERDLYDVFAQYGKINDVQIVYDGNSGKSRGFGFVYFERIEDAVAAKKHCHGLQLDGRHIRTDYSLTNRPHTPTPGVYMGRSSAQRYREHSNYSSCSRSPSFSRSRHYHHYRNSRTHPHRSHRRRHSSSSYSNSRSRSRSSPRVHANHNMAPSTSSNPAPTIFNNNENNNNDRFPNNS